MADVEMVPGGGSWITRALAASGAVRLLVVEADEVADALREAHQLDPKGAVLAAEAAIATLLMSAYTKGAERLTLRIGFERPSARFVGELDGEHRFRGRFSPTPTPDDLDPQRLQGLMFAAKHDGTREVYRGVTSLEGVSITEALRGHLMESSQVHGVLGTHVAVVDGRVVAAVGLLAERLPPAAGQPSIEVSAFLERYGGIERGDIAADVAGVVGGSLWGETVEILEQRPVFWACTCSYERVVGALAGLPSDELRAMAREDRGAEVDCHFCNAHYHVSEETLLRLAGNT
jgi:molecular chaperone Hsp33